jgi:hypothetical protein
VPCSWWAVSALAAVERDAEATARADALCQTLPTLISEEVDPETTESLGNTPLLWSHMELAGALYLLDTGRIRRRWGAIGVAMSARYRPVEARLRRRRRTGARPRGPGRFRAVFRRGATGRPRPDADPAPG